MVMAIAICGYGQGQNPSLGYSGTLCVGKSITIYLVSSQNCGTISVSSNSSWSFSPSPSSVSYSSNRLSVNATWNTATTVYVNVSYNCSTGGSGSTGTNIPINPGPSLGAAIGNLGTICQGGTVELDVVNQANVGITPTYEYYIDGSFIYSGSETRYYYSTPNLSAGSHSAYIKVTSGGSTCVGIAQSQPVNFSLTANQTYKVDVNGPITYCPTRDPSPSFHANPSTTYTTPTYQWYANGSPAGNSNPVTIPISQQTNVYCVVSQGTSSQYPCITSPVTSNTFVVGYSAPVTPSVQIQSVKYTYCTGESISFGAVGQNITGSPSYAWYLDGTLFSSSQSPPALMVGPVAGSGVFGPGSVVSVTVSNIGGSCLMSNTASYTLPINAVTVNMTPHLNNVPPISICSGQSFSINLDYSVPGTTYQWTQTATSVNGSSNSQGPYAAPTLSQTLTSSSGGSVQYTITPTANGCVGSSAIAQLTVNPIPSVPILSSSGVFSRCGAGPINLNSLVGTYGTEVHWYDGSGTNATYLGNANSITPSITTNTTYYVSNYNSSTACESSRVSVQAQVKDKYTAPVNNVITQNVQVEGLGVSTDLTAQPIDKVLQTVQYFDGLGRHYQDVLQQNSPGGSDLVQSSVYDRYGREVIKYLPMTVGSDGCPKDMDSQGNYVNTAAQNFYTNTSKVASDTRPFSQSTFEPSPLSRALQEAGPGATWNDASKYISHQYLVNQTNEVYLFNFDPSTGLVSLGSGTAAYFDAGQLQSKVTADEQGNEVREYTDKLGRVLCKKVQYQTDGNGVKQYASTYYVYDDFGNLAAVLPPEAVKKIISQLN